MPFGMESSSKLITKIMTLNVGIIGIFPENDLTVFFKMCHTLIRVNARFSAISILPVCRYQGWCASRLWIHAIVWIGGSDRYQNIFRITVWLFFLFVYSQAGKLQSPLKDLLLIFSKWPVREPLEKIDTALKGFDKWEVVLYLFSLSFFLEGKRAKLTTIHKGILTSPFATNRYS